MTGTRQFSILVMAVIAVPTGCFTRQEEKEDKQPLSVEKLLGRLRDAVREEFGKPDRTGDGLDSFYKSGIVVRYNDAGMVTKVTATKFVSGDVFVGKVLGIALGDTKKDCVAAWGDPVQTERTSLGYNIVVWHFKCYVLELELWAEDGNDMYFGQYKKDAVKRIEVSERSK